MPRASDISLDDQNMSFLLIGENGSHKTRFLASIPHEVYVFDFDKGMASVAGAPRIEYDTFKDVAPGALAKPEEGRYPYGEGWSKFIDKFNSIAKSVNEGKAPHKVFVWDSYTFASELLENRLAKLNDRVGKPLEIQHWQTFNREMRNALNTFIGWPGIKIVTAHVERAENPITKTQEQLPLANSKMQGLLPNFFDEVYFCDVKIVPDPKDATKKIQVPSLQTVRDPIRKNARSRWHVPQDTPTDWNALIGAIRASAGATASGAAKKTM